MKPYTSPSRPRLFVVTSSVVLFALLLAACGGASTPGGSGTPAPGKTATLQTGCPSAGTARAAIMAPFTPGNQATFVYLEANQQAQQGPASYTLKRYTVSTRTATNLLSGSYNPAIAPQISANGQWVMLNPILSGGKAIQLVRMDGQELQTLYCAYGDDFGWVQWSPDNKYVAFVDLGTPGSDLSKWTFKLLNTTTGTIQTKTRDHNHLLAFPEAWLDPTHLLVIWSGLPGEGSNTLSLLDITTWTSKPILTPPSYCFDAAFSIDGTRLLTSQAPQADCPVMEGWNSSNLRFGPSSIRMQAITGGQAKTIYSTPTDAITQLRIATNTSLLLFISTSSPDTVHNGFWKMNTDGTGLTRLSSEAAIVKDKANEEVCFTGIFGWNMDQPWANVSRDGAYYSFQVYNHGNGPSRVLIGSMNGGVPLTVASGSVEAPVGWTTM